MKFIVSDHLPGENRFGKWHYTHDRDVKIYRDLAKTVLWFGYTIEQDIRKFFLKDIKKLKQANGNFCVVVLYKDRMEVCLDYFGQTKVYYHIRDGLTVTNQLALLPLTKSDIKTWTVDRFMQGLGEDVPMYACKDPMNMQFIYQWNDFSHDNTVFNYVSSVPRDHWLVHENDETTLKKIHDTYRTNFTSFRNKKIKKIDDTELEDKIHQCMEQHSTVIKKNYRNICSSISEGIDSTLQDQYFSAKTRLMYHPKDSTTIEELPPKANLIEQYKDRKKKINFDVFDVTKIDNITKENICDPMLSWVDTVPTIWQVNKLSKKPDVLMYGSYGDEMFMHLPKFLFAMVPPHRREEYADCYGGRKSPARPFVDPYQKRMVDDWQNKFAKMALPNRYGRDIEAQTGVFTTSLYADRRIFHLLHKATYHQQIDSMANVGTQKRILNNKFKFDFKTKFKDGAGYECRMVIKQLLTNVIDKIVK